jgi:hypothetical protein
MYVCVCVYIYREAGTARAGEESSQSIYIHTYNLCIPITLQALLQLVKTAAKQEPPVGLNGQPSRQTAQTTAEAETKLADADGKKVPISSKHDPAYVHAEEDRDLQAQVSVYIYIYMLPEPYTHTHTHTRIYACR